MDNIQFWIYVIFGIIYFVARNFKKKSQEKAKNQPSIEGAEGNGETVPAQSFEELLKEITGRKSVKPESRPVIEEESDRYLQPKPWEEEVKQVIDSRSIFEKEGETRAFADEESRRVYEESMKRAEGSEFDYEVDKKYANSKVLLETETAEGGKENKVADEIREMLTNTSSARKAFIAGEIFQTRF
ncbi:MAG: hypothetical protein ACI8QD_000373 [Cyclobacteriaceae bacterium]|jgi:hypothetical protein